MPPVCRWCQDQRPAPVAPASSDAVRDELQAALERATEAESVLRVLDDSLRAAAEDCRRAASKYESQARRRSALEAKLAEEEEALAVAQERCRKQQHVDALQARVDRAIRQSQAVAASAMQRRAAAELHVTTATEEAAAEGCESVYAVISAGRGQRKAVKAPAPAAAAAPAARPRRTAGAAARPTPSAGAPHRRSPSAGAYSGRSEPRPAPGRAPPSPASRRPASPAAAGRRPASPAARRSHSVGKPAPKPAHNQPPARAAPRPHTPPPARAPPRGTSPPPAAAELPDVAAAERRVADAQRSLQSLEADLISGRLKRLQQSLRKTAPPAQTGSEGTAAEAQAEWARLQAALGSTCPADVTPADVIRAAHRRHSAAVNSALGRLTDLLDSTGLLAGETPPVSEMFDLWYLTDALLTAPEGARSGSVVGDDVRWAESCVAAFSDAPGRDRVAHHHAKLQGLLPPRRSEVCRPPSAALPDPPPQWCELLRSEGAAQAVAAHVERCVVAEPLMALYDRIAPLRL
eukprot:TRINITY_DN24489_c0_g1_i1.p1 TRINITY_DN24489_c0_g1~~TRINITY_DN24489_c0_g1_i1.p1  ORF type:complete len:548 (+),score=180.25 TRINITY_DN24489_c0_g1_i1:87-1646(+)